MNLTDMHLVMLSAAAQRDDHLLTPPARLTGGAREKVAARLMRLGAVEEVGIGLDAPLWFESDGARIGLRVTLAGLTAIGIVPEGEPAGDATELGDGATEPTRTAESSPRPAMRAGTKKSYLLALIGRESGARLDELIEATGWLPHTTRAALTGLRRAGHALAKTRDDEGRTVYRIEAPAARAATEA